MTAEQFTGRDTPVPSLRLRTFAGTAAASVRSRLRPSRALQVNLTAPSPLFKQTPVIVLFGAAVIITLLSASVHVTSRGAIATGLALLIAATLLAVGLTRRGPAALRWERLVPAIDFFAIEALRMGTGGSTFPFGALVLVPAIWLAASAGRSSIGFAGLGVSVVFLMPYALTPSLLVTDSTGLIRGLFTVAGYTIAAGAVNELAVQSRARLDVAQASEQVVVGELHRGGEMQQALLPTDGTPVPGYHVAGTCLPARAVGGDFYDWYPVPGGIGFTIGDVMGKGVGAGMIAATTRAVVRSARNEAEPEAAVRLANACLVSELHGADSFATLFHARLRADDGRIRFADAGHGLSVIVRTDGSWQRLGSADMPVGMGLDEEWASHDARLEPGDVLVTFSDGVLDLYEDTDAALAAVAAMASAAVSPADLVDTIRRRCADGDNPDDITVLALQRDRIPA